ncbi:hypothetical protein K439DRAFT_1231550, partial [Ramaria rubella]
MGKLNIAHHKSYHPYRQDNIERVRKDEEEAKLKEEGEEGRMRVADSEARLDLLRGRASGSKRSLKRKEGEEPPPLPEMAALTTISTSTGHINLFADFEQHAMTTSMIRSREVAAKKVEDEKGFRLAPSAKDLKPWYTDKDTQKEEMTEDKRLKDLSSKKTFDPLTSIQSELSRSYPSNSTSSLSSARRIQPPSNTSEARVQRESSERARALELIRRKKREKEREALGMANMTPSSVADGLDRDVGYRDVYNRQETEDAHRRRDRG